MLKRLFKPRPAQTAGRALYALAVAQSRNPTFFTDLGAPDTPEGRFEIYSLHVYLLLERLKEQGAQAGEVGQALFDAYLSALDHGLRELGVGDLAVGKRMRKLGEAFYGRVNAYEKALAALPERSELEALIARTVYAGADPAHAPKLADYVTMQRAGLAEQALDRLLAGDVAWSAP
jgi:cytochrome b pre-mRNA-processing protein 3